MVFDKKKWPIFSCDSLFEPATFSGMGGMENPGQLQNLVSIPGTVSPEVGFIGWKKQRIKFADIKLLYIRIPQM